MNEPDTTESAATPPAKLAHNILRTARFDDVVDWWKTVFCAHVRHENDLVCFLTSGRVRADVIGRAVGGSFSNPDGESR